MTDQLTAHAAVAGWAEKSPDREFLVQPDGDEVRVLTFREAWDRATRMASALGDLGLEPGDKVAILGKNTAEWVLADLAIAMAGMVSIPIYPTASADTVSYIIGHSEAKAAFIGKLDEPGTVARAIPSTLITISFPYPTIDCHHALQDLIDGAEPLATPRQPEPDDVMTILYTSGSTGRPKGAVMTFAACVNGCLIARRQMDLGPDDRILSYLPLAHVTERLIVVGPMLFAGGSIFFVDSLDTFSDDLKRARPSAFVSVPRLWVKFQSAVHAKIPPSRLRLLLAIPIIGRLVARKIRIGLGLDQCRLIGSGSAPISPDTLRWYRKIGVNISEAWGMTETGGLSCANLPYDPKRIGTIGVPVEGTELRISDEGELLIRCPSMFREYYKKPALTKEAFTDDGFFRTGDKAVWDEEHDGYRITGRVKDIFKTAKGKYVVPVPIESHLASNPLLEQVCVVGSGLPAPIAVVVLSDAARRLPRDTITASLTTTLDEANRHLESHERLGGIYVVDEEWTTENGFLTPTLKVKREQLDARYLGELDGDFKGPVAWEKPS